MPSHFMCLFLFKQTIKDVAFVGPSFAPLGDHKLRTTLLDKEYSNVNLQLIQHVCKLANMMVKGAYKHIFWTPCYIHALNNALKDIGKIDLDEASVRKS